MPGTLFVVATPIGNLEDLTFRGLRTLREVDLIAAEDTRRTAKLLAHYEIRKPMVSLREHNESRETPKLLDRIAAGESIALVTDAGTPGIADPGARLVRGAHDRQLPVVPIPGPSAVATALSVSGFSGDQFVFAGFPPSSGSGREAWLKAIADERRIVVFFEAPHRIQRTIDDVSALLGTRQMFVARELSKKFEELVVSPTKLASGLTPAGEFTLVVGPMPDLARHASPSDAEIADLFGRLTNNGAFQDTEASEIVSKLMAVDERQIKKAVKKARILVNNQRSSSA
jgi:16S rRNA (cytidine1402-2'-O)-methyltransferase